jgi:hypothetical protein
MPRTRSLSILALISFFSISCLVGQQSATPTSVLASALSGMGGATIQAISLTGTAESYAGSSNDTGTFIGSCSTSGSSQLSLQMSGGSLTESRQATNGVPSGNWVDSSGNQHAMVQHNLYTSSSWFCPVIALSQLVSSSNLNIQFIGEEQKNGATLEHFTSTQLQTNTGAAYTLATHLSQMDIYLNPQTQMPVVFDFTIHPDSDAGTDIPVEIQFSNYTKVNGVWIPFTVQKYINSALVLTLQVQSASIGSATSNN